MGRPSRMALVNINSAMSGRPQGPYTVKKRKPRRRQAVQVAVRVGHQLVGLLGRRIQADRMVHVVVLGERHVRVAAIDARARRVHQVRHLAVAAPLQHIGEADDVAVDIGMRVDQRIAHAGLRSKMNNLVEALGLEQGLHAGPVGNIQLH